MDIRQGNTIKFIAKFKPVVGSSVTSWDDVDNVIIYAYTCGDYVVKMSLLEKTGYNKIEYLNSLNLLCSINASQTKHMCGELMLELYIKDTDESLIPEEIGVNVIEMGITITESLIKAEV